MFHVELGVKLTTKPQRQGSTHIVPNHPGFIFSGSLKHIHIMFTECPGGFGYSQELWDAWTSIPHLLRPKVSVWTDYGERFANRMTKKRWEDELRSATTADHTIVIPKNGIGGNF
jgi:hypothetical protein